MLGFIIFLGKHKKRNVHCTHVIKHGDLKQERQLFYIGATYWSLLSGLHCKHKAANYSEYF